MSFFSDNTQNNDVVNEEVSKIHDVYTIRTKCIFCNNDDFEMLFDHSNYTSSLSLGLNSDKNEKSHFMPYNVQICKICKTFQNKYLGDLAIIYGVNHADDYGSTKSKKHSLFCNFICENKHIDGIVEVGSCNGVLANNVLQTRETEYNIIEPSFTGDKTNLNIISDYFENVNLNAISANTLIMSDVFEHFYNPLDILNKIRNSENIKYIYLNHPDFDYSIKNNVYMNLNCEHTFLIEHQFLFVIFENFGFKLTRRNDFDNHSLFLEFERMNNSKIVEKAPVNYNLYEDGKKYFNTITHVVKNINDYIISNSSKKMFIWPTSVHAVTLLTCGLIFEKLRGVLDNSPNKIGKYLYGYNLLCSSFNDILNSNDNDICIIIGGAGPYTKELVLVNKNIDIRFVEDFL